MKLPSLKQRSNRRTITVQNVVTKREKREQEQRSQQGNAKLGTDADVLAYMRRMGYINAEGKLT